MSSSSYNYCTIRLTYNSETELKKPRVDNEPLPFIVNLSLIHSTHPTKKRITLNLAGPYPPGQNIISNIID